MRDILAGAKPQYRLAGTPAQDEQAIHAALSHVDGPPPCAEVRRFLAAASTFIGEINMSSLDLRLHYVEFHHAHCSAAKRTTSFANVPSGYVPDPGTSTPHLLKRQPAPTPTFPFLQACHNCGKNGHIERNCNEVCLNRKATWPSSPSTELTNLPNLFSFSRAVFAKAKITRSVAAATANTASSLGTKSAVVHS